MLELRRLRYFVTVADELHFGRAALRLRIAQPPLTRHIAALEARLGIRLFERSTRTVCLTPEGELFLQQARGVISAVGEAEATARKIAHGAIGRIVIGYASSIPLSNAFSEMIRNTSRSLPEVELAFREVSTASQRQQLIDGSLDIGFGWGAPNLPAHGLQSLVSSRDSLVVAVPSRSAFAGRSSLGFCELAGESFVTFPSAYGSALNTALEDLCAHSGIIPRLGPTASQMTTLMSLVAAERGVAVVPDYTATLQRPGVVYVPLAEPYVLEQTVSWRTPLGSRCLERFVELARTLAAPLPAPAAGPEWRLRG
ncbi:LysR substrate-binding domain-containing protein [Pseudomonas protegens]|uniref:LysR substrate-binding domain-containing protein n=1 Tax=Pseudomonas protegens TaxID=380021 RepID=UPI00381FB173